MRDRDAPSAVILHAVTGDAKRCVSGVHRRIYYDLAVHAHRAGLPPVALVSEDGTVKALALLLAFAATLLAGAERIYVANTGGADISVIDPATNSVIGVIRVSKHPHAIVASLDKSRLYVPSEQEDVLDVVDLGTSWDRAPNQGQFRAPAEGQLYADGSVSFKLLM